MLRQGLAEVLGKLDRLGVTTAAQPSPQRRYSSVMTDEGKKYFVPKAGGDPVWELPADGVVVANSDDK